MKWGDFTVRYERKSESYRINGKSNPSEKKLASISHLLPIRIFSLPLNIPILFND
jgi:hypothetical protein